jgi:four helix bundle protein
MDSFTSLDAWKTGMKLVKEVYLLTDKLPNDERFGLISQMRRASISVLANLAEGFSRSGSADKAYKYTISRGECSEVEALLLVTVELSYFKTADVEQVIDLAQKTGRLLSGLIRVYSSQPKPKPQPNV